MATKGLPKLWKKGRIWWFYDSRSGKQKKVSTRTEDYTVARERQRKHFGTAPPRRVPRVTGPGAAPTAPVEEGRTVDEAMALLEAAERGEAAPAEPVAAPDSEPEQPAAGVESGEAAGASVSAAEVAADAAEMAGDSASGDPSKGMRFEDLGLSGAEVGEMLANVLAALQVGGQAVLARGLGYAGVRWVKTDRLKPLLKTPLSLPDDSAGFKGVRGVWAWQIARWDVTGKTPEPWQMAIGAGAVALAQQVAAAYQAAGVAEPQPE